MSSPIARALIGKSEGDTAEVKAPGGVREYEVLAVRYTLGRTAAGRQSLADSAAVDAPGHSRTIWIARASNRLCGARISTPTAQLGTLACFDAWFVEIPDRLPDMADGCPPAPEIARPRPRR